MDSDEDWDGDGDGMGIEMEMGMDTGMEMGMGWGMLDHISPKDCQCVQWFPRRRLISNELEGNGKWLPFDCSIDTA